MPKKTERGDPLRLLTSILSQNIKKLKGDPCGKNFFSEKKVSQRRKNLKGTLQSLLVLYVTRKNIKNRYGSVR